MFSDMFSSGAILNVESGIYTGYILLAYRRRAIIYVIFDINLCYTMILRRATKKDPKFKIRRRKNIKIKRGVKRPNT